MKKFLGLLICCILLYSCSTKAPVVIPDTVLPVEKMAAVLMDVHLLEASMNLNSFNPDKIAVNKPKASFDVLKKHEITQQQYEESFNFYTAHPNLLSNIYDLVLNDLSKMQAEVMNKN